MFWDEPKSSYKTAVINISFILLKEILAYLNMGQIKLKNRILQRKQAQNLFFKIDGILLQNLFIVPQKIVVFYRDFFMVVVVNVVLLPCF